MSGYVKAEVILGNANNIAVLVQSTLHSIALDTTKNLLDELEKTIACRYSDSEENLKKWNALHNYCVLKGYQFEIIFNLAAHHSVKWTDLFLRALTIIDVNSDGETVDSRRVDRLFGLGQLLHLKGRDLSNKFNIEPVEFCLYPPSKEVSIFEKSIEEDFFNILPFDEFCDFFETLDEIDKILAIRLCNTGFLNFSILHKKCLLREPVAFSIWLNQWAIQCSDVDKQKTITHIVRYGFSDTISIKVVDISSDQNFRKKSLFSLNEYLLDKCMFTAKSFELVSSENLSDEEFKSLMNCLSRLTQLEKITLHGTKDYVLSEEKSKIFIDTMIKCQKLNNIVFSDLKLHDDECYQRLNDSIFENISIDIDVDDFFAHGGYSEIQQKFMDKRNVIRENEGIVRKSKITEKIEQDKAFDLSIDTGLKKFTQDPHCAKYFTDENSKYIFYRLLETLGEDRLTFYHQYHRLFTLIDWVKQEKITLSEIANHDRITNKDENFYRKLPKLLARCRVSEMFETNEERARYDVEDFDPRRNPTAGEKYKVKDAQEQKMSEKYEKYLSSFFEKVILPVAEKRAELFEILTKALKNSDKKDCFGFNKVSAKEIALLEDKIDLLTSFLKKQCTDLKNVELETEMGKINGKTTKFAVYSCTASDANKGLNLTADASYRNEYHGNVIASDFSIQYAPKKSVTNEARNWMRSYLKALFGGVAGLLCIPAVVASNVVGVFTGVNIYTMNDYGAFFRTRSQHILAKAAENASRLRFTIVH